MTDKPSIFDTWRASIGYTTTQKNTKTVEPGAPTLHANDPGGYRYAKAALTDEATELGKLAPNSHKRNQTLNAAAYALGRYVGAGYIGEDEVCDELRKAAERTLLPGHEIQSILPRSVREGAADPKYVPTGEAHAPEATVLDGAINGPESHTDGTEDDEGTQRPRTVHLTAAAEIKMRPIKWIWKGRLALGTLALIGGREGIGKSTVGYQLAADITRGKLPGNYHGHPKGVIVAATEDSWEHTIVPRLAAAGADLARIYRVDVVTIDGIKTELSLPKDLGELERAIVTTDTALILLDPLMSRLDASLDTHKDAEVRIALEPLVQLADNCNATVVGLIHVNKSTGSNDALTMIMGSRAFSAVARAVLFVMVDPEDDTKRLLGQSKNNLGRSDLPTLTFRIEDVTVGHHEDGPIESGQLVWIGETEQTIQDALANTTDDPDIKSATEEAADWLSDYLLSKGGAEESSLVKKAGAAAGHTSNALARARRRLRITAQNRGYPRRTVWLMPEAVTDE